MKRVIRNSMLCIILIIFSSINQGCTENGGLDNTISSFAKKTPFFRNEAASCYASALYWNEVSYQPTADKPIDNSSINIEIGQITRKVESVPKSNGEINDLRDFSVGDRLFGIKQVEETEAIAVQRNDTYYRLDRIRSSLGVIWDGRVYDFVGNFDQENMINDIDRQIGLIKGSSSNPVGATNGEITVSGVEADSSNFPVGCKIYSLKNVSLDSAIAVEDKNGKYHKAVYVKRNR